MSALSCITPGTPDADAALTSTFVRWTRRPDDLPISWDEGRERVGAAPPPVAR